MKIIETSEKNKLAIKYWSEDIDQNTLEQAINLSNHPIITQPIVLLPDNHCGYGMPIGCVVVTKNAVIPNAVGVDIGCGMYCSKTNIPASLLTIDDLSKIRHSIKRSVPVGRNVFKDGETSDDVLKIKKFHMELFRSRLQMRKKDLPGGVNEQAWKLAEHSLGTLGGGNHFIEIQKGDDGFVYIMLHTGSRNIGFCIANHYHRLAIDWCKTNNVKLPSDDLAYLPTSLCYPLTHGSDIGDDYLCDMRLASDYAAENRRLIIQAVKKDVCVYLEKKGFETVCFVDYESVHNYADESYSLLGGVCDNRMFTHRKGACSARKNKTVIIAGSMGTSSYLVKGLGNTESIQSCSHGAGRNRSRGDSNRMLNKEDCEKAMTGIVFDGFEKRKTGYILDEAPGAYKDIETVINQELDLIEVVTKLTPMAVIKG